MRELIQRLSALDDDAASAMKMIAHFDALLAQGAGVTALVRGAAVLSGWPCGIHLPEHSLYARVDAQGRAMKPLDESAIQGWPHQRLIEGSDGMVWLERPAERAGSNDAMILERLAAGIHLTLERVSPSALSDDAAAIEIIVTASSPAALRKAVRRLHFGEDSMVRVVVSGPAVAPASRSSAAISSTIGPIQVGLLQDGEMPLAEPCGIGSRVPVLEAQRSLRQSLVALAMASRITPVVDWDEWGALAELAASADRIRHPDVERIAAISTDPAAVDTLEALAVSDSIRGAANLLNLHHSTVQQRQARLEETLGFHITSPAGRTRVLVALASLRLRDFNDDSDAG
jgi:hypothetical protein